MRRGIARHCPPHRAGDEGQGLERLEVTPHRKRWVSTAPPGFVDCGVAETYSARPPRMVLALAGNSGELGPREFAHRHEQAENSIAGAAPGRRTIRSMGVITPYKGHLVHQSLAVVIGECREEAATCGALPSLGARIQGRVSRTRSWVLMVDWCLGKANAGRRGFLRHAFAG